MSGRSLPGRPKVTACPDCGRPRDYAFRVNGGAKPKKHGSPGPVRLVHEDTGLVICRGGSGGSGGSRGTPPPSEPDTLSRDPLPNDPPEPPNPGFAPESSGSGPANGPANRGGSGGSSLAASYFM